MPLQPGQILNNRYRVDRLLGQGGFGAVYLAWDQNLNAQVAIKENIDFSPASEKQFRSEAGLLFKLHHSNLPRVHDCFSVSNQGLYLTMDYIDGESLENRLLRHGGPLPVEQVLAWIGPICDALEYLHHQVPPVIHRDIKPANIIVRRDGCPFLVDFGISKVFDLERKTTLGARAYTPGYSPPEQYGTAPTDVRSDIYSLGATVYHLLSGKVPPSSMDISSGVVSPPEPLQIHNPSVPQSANLAVIKAMQINRTQRWNNSVEFKQALLGRHRLQEASATQVVQLTQAGVHYAPGSIPQTQVVPVISRTSHTATITEHITPKRVWSAGLFLVIGGGILLVLIVGMLLGLQAIQNTRHTEVAAVIDTATSKPTEAGRSTSVIMPTEVVIPTEAVVPTEAVIPTDVPEPTQDIPVILDTKKPIVTQIQKWPVSETGVEACHISSGALLYVGENARIWSKPDVVDGEYLYPIPSNSQIEVLGGPVWGRVIASPAHYGWWWEVTVDGVSGWVWQSRIKECGGN